MSRPNAEALEGDGINLAFFHLMWNKAEQDEQNYTVCESSKDVVRRHPIRVPDTIAFQFGHPLYWYFTSKRGGRDGKSTTILRKRKQNVTVELIKDLFLKKASTNGNLSPNDVVAYFIASAGSTSRFHQGTNVENGAKSRINKERFTNPRCDIQYFDREGLCRWLEHGRKNQTGILQRFLRPTGGGTHNSTIQAIWTPNLCLVERRRTNKSLYDERFGLYERSVTFEGPNVHSTSKRVRGTILLSKIESMCNEMVSHVSEVTGEGHDKHHNGDRELQKTARALSRMVVYFKIDINDDIWVLFTTSLRLENGGGMAQLKLYEKPILSRPLNLVNEKEGLYPTNNTNILMPLNIENVVKIGPTVRLNPSANHDPTKVLENEVTLACCPSCENDLCNELFYPVSYKTIISHFEAIVEMSKHEVGLKKLVEWPPDSQLIKAAGGVGFGAYKERAGKKGGRIFTQNAKAVSELPEEETVIPAVIKGLHPRLKVQAYRRYRIDPLFLHRDCYVCENCFLAYAQLASTSFQMNNPIRLEDCRLEAAVNSKGKCRRPCLEEIYNDECQEKLVTFKDDIKINSQQHQLDMISLKATPKRPLLRTVKRVNCRSMPANSSNDLIESYENSKLATNDRKRTPQVDPKTRRSPYEEELDKLIAAR